MKIFKKSKKFKKVKKLKQSNKELRTENERLHGKLTVKQQQLDSVIDTLQKINVC